MIGIDANVLVHAFDSSDPVKHEACQRIVRRIFDGTLSGAVTTQVLGEFAFVITRKVKRPLPRDTAAKIITVIQSSVHWTVFSYAGEDVTFAVLRDGHFWDNVIASTLMRHGVHTIMTYNTKDYATSGLLVQLPS